MNRYVMLGLLLMGAGCGTFFRVGDNTNKKDDLINRLPDGGQCGPVCAIYCEYGNVPDADGCPTCACNPPPNTTPDAGQQCGPVCAIYCEYGNVLDAAGCPTCACNPPPNPTPDAGQECGPVCAIYCEYGNVLDANGCPTCACNPAPADAGSPGTACGFNTCGVGTECCNASCGICVPTGGFCTQQACACAQVVCTLACQYGFQRGADGCETCACAPAPVTCGNVICGGGQECCNASCGICVAPGGACTQQACN